MSDYVINIDLAKEQLTYTARGRTQMQVPIVHGCDGSSPVGNFRAGKWIRDKTNPVHGPTPWSKDNWGNPYGPYFLQILNQKGKYTTYGVHGTRGPADSKSAKPPMPQSLLKWVLGDETTKYLYCSHGCIRISNADIQKLYDLTTPVLVKSGTVTIKISKDQVTKGR
jgi:lipoprotein-anchoring transpeptidase ErfK/SrfK